MKSDNFLLEFVDIIAVRNYAQIAEPLHEVTKHGEQFLWTYKRDAALEQLKLI